MESKNDYELTTVPNDMLLPSYELTVEESNSENRAARKEKKAGKCQCCMIFIIYLIAFLALCAGVAAIVLIVVYPNVTSTVPSDAQNLKDEIAELKKEIAELRLEVEATQPPPTQPPLTQPPAIGSFENPASSCTAIPEDRTSGIYWIDTASTSVPIQVYCDMDQRNCGDDMSGWLRIAKVNMSDPEQECPTGFDTITVNVADTGLMRLCSKKVIGCTSVLFPTYGIDYSQICGRVVGHRHFTGDGFNPDIGIDSTYV